MQGTRSHGTGTEGAGSSPGQNQGRPWGRGELRAGLHPGAFCCTTMVRRSSSRSLPALTHPSPGPAVAPRPLPAPWARRRAGRAARHRHPRRCRSQSHGTPGSQRREFPPSPSQAHKKNTQKPGGDAALHLLKPLPAALAASPRPARLHGEGASTKLGTQKRPWRGTHGPAAGEGGSGKEPEPRGAGHGAGHGAPGLLEEWGSSAGPLGCPAQGEGSRHGHLLHHGGAAPALARGRKSTDPRAEAAAAGKQRARGCWEASRTPPPALSIHPRRARAAVLGGDTLQPALSLPP